MKFRKSRKFRPVRVVRLGGHNARTPSTELDAALAEVAASEAVTAAPKSAVSVNVSGLSRTGEVREDQGNPYDEALLEKSRTQWQFGDWQSLTRLTREKVAAHPERAKLALLVAAAHQQTDNLGEVRVWVGLAQSWGVSKQLVSRVLIAGVYQTLGHAALIAQDENKAEKWLNRAVSTGMPGSEARLWSAARRDSAAKRLSADLRQAKRQLVERQSETPPWLASVVDDCLAAEDVHASADKAVDSYALEGAERAHFYLAIAERFRERRDNLTMLHFLSSAREHLPVGDTVLRSLLVQRFLQMGRPELAMELSIGDGLEGLDILENLSEPEVEQIRQTFEATRQAQTAHHEHGHEVLLAYLRRNLDGYVTELSGRKPILIEIGTTREKVPGQGSTEKLARFCIDHGVQFITVDMDPHNTHMANELFERLGGDCQAVTMKGEDYLRDYPGNFDFVFLDAYDFDHGKHSDLRQSRYEKYLGSPINEQECHRMHLDCALSVMKKLAPRGVVCMDDTWLDDGKWTAKGTLAVPYLLEHGFQLLDVRNRAALLSR